MGIPELREELAARGLDTIGRKSILIQRLMLDDNKVEEVEENWKSEEEVEENWKSEEEVEENWKSGVGVGVNDVVSVVGTMEKFFDSAPVGVSIVATRQSADSWLFGVGNASVVPVSAKMQSSGRGLKGRAFEREAYSSKYYTFHYEDAGDGQPWTGRSVEDKYAYADELGVTWEKYDNVTVDTMRMVKAIYEKLGIEKWKPEYKSKVARDALR